MLLSLCVLAAVLKSMRWLRAETFEADDAILEASEYSSFTVHVSASGTGLMNKYFYRFGNVRIRRGRMKFYFDADGSFVPPTEELWVDIISCNATSARPPTMLVVKVDAPVRWEYMPIDYVPVVKRTDACHAGATSVVSRLAYLLQVRYSYNIWHTWGEAGLMSMFQTLREINQLPIATVGPSGSLHEIFDGGIDGGGDSGGDGGCPWTYDQALQRPVRPDACERRRIPRGATCSFNSHPWCRPGAVVSPLRDDPAAPLIVTYSPQSTKNVWSHLYDTILSDQKTLAELEGACFEDLVVGKSSTLNFYQALNTTTPAAAILAKVPRIDFARARVDAMSTFKPFIISGQREWVERQGLAFGGYADEGLERLRQGVTHPDDEALLSMNVNGGVAGNVREEINELRKNFEAHEAQVAGSVEKYELLYGRVVAPTTLNSQQAVELRDEESEAFFARIGNEETVGGAAGGAGGSGTAGTRTTSTTPSTTPSTTTTRRDLPVVVYMSRNFASRGVLNEIDILRFVLSKYDVVLKDTTCQEPLHETMDLLSSSDVLLGMHGAGWTNLLFMKGNASTLQLFPYGFRLPGGGILRGANYREIVFASRGSYLEWVNPSSANSYQRRIDFKKRKESKFVLHPQDHEPTGSTGPTGAGTNEIVYANTWVDIKLVGPVIDRAMAAAGILPKR